jgi:ABC-type glycerol-3-phosphate transport system substrate-binding protein
MANGSVSSKKSSSLVLIATLLAIAVTFPAAARTKVLHLLNPAHGDACNNMVTKLAAEFNASYDEGEVVLEMGPNNYNEKVFVMIAAGTPPDVTHTVHNQGAAMIHRHALADLNRLAQADGIDLKKYIVPAALSALTWDGVQFGIPIFGQTIVTYYNLDLLNQTGSVPPIQLAERRAWNWDAYLEIAKKNTRDINGDGRPDIWGSSNSFAFDRAPIWVWQAGDDLFDKPANPSRSTMLNDAALYALQWLIDLNTVHNVVGGNMFQGNQALAWNYHAGDASWFDTANFEWDTAPLPTGPVSNQTAVFFNNVQITAASPNKEAAWKWVKYITLNAENVAAFGIAAKRPPVMREAFITFNAAIKKPAHRQVWFDQLNNARSITLTHIINDVIQVFGPELNKVVAGQAALHAVLANMDTQFNALLKQ